MSKEIRAEYLKRFTVCLLGLFFYAVGNFLGVKAGAAGTNAWNTLSLGFVESAGITFGTAGLIISFIVIGIDLIGKGKIGFGTLMNGVLISIMSDILLNHITFIPEAPNNVIGAIYTLVGQTVISFVTILYMKPALGCGPRDTLMVIVKNFCTSNRLRHRSLCTGIPYFSVFQCDVSLFNFTKVLLF